MTTFKCLTFIKKSLKTSQFLPLQIFFTDVRVPFLIRGPGVIRNKTIKGINVNIDIAPTIIDMSGQSFNPYHFDGISLLPYITEEQENYLKTGNFEIILLQEFHIRL